MGARAGERRSWNSEHGRSAHLSYVFGESQPTFSGDQVVFRQGFSKDRAWSPDKSVTVLGVHGGMQQDMRQATSFMFCILGNAAKSKCHQRSVILSRGQDFDKRGLYDQDYSLTGTGCT